MNKGQSGQATLLGLLVIAMSSAVVAMQMRTIEQQSIEEQLDRRAENARTFGSLALARVQDLFGAQYIVERCDGRRAFVMVNPELEAEKYRAISRIWDTSTQSAAFKYCDFKALTKSDRATMYAPSGGEPENCTKVPVVVKVPTGTCKAPMVMTASVGLPGETTVPESARGQARLSALLDTASPAPKAKPKSPEKGCPFTCHTGQDGKNERKRKVGGS